jgi:hypothetical protein
VSDNEFSNDASLTSLVGSATLLNEISKTDEFLIWSEENHNLRELDEILEGYRVLTRTALHILGDSYLMESGPLEIKKDFKFIKSLRELGDIDKIQSDCEAAALSRKINDYNRQLALSTTADELREQITRITEDLANPVLDLAPEDVYTTSESLTIDQAAT